jgi:hypothetical protein
MLQHLPAIYIHETSIHAAYGKMYPQVPHGHSIVEYAALSLDRDILINVSDPSLLDITLAYHGFHHG